MNFIESTNIEKTQKSVYANKFFFIYIFDVKCSFNKPTKGGKTCWDLKLSI
jgi:hypothetical protein